MDCGAAGQRADTDDHPVVVDSSGEAETSAQRPEADHPTFLRPGERLVRSSGHWGHPDDHAVVVDHRRICSCWTEIDLPTDLRPHKITAAVEAGDHPLDVDRIGLIGAAEASAKCSEIDHPGALRPNERVAFRISGR